MQLNNLDSDFETLFEAAKEKTLVFGDRFPFRYFVDDYGLDYFAAFIGCSAESEASFETMIRDLVFAQSDKDDRVADLHVIRTGRCEKMIASIDLGNQNILLQTKLLKRNIASLALFTDMEFHRLGIRIRKLVQIFHLAAHGSLHRADELKDIIGCYLLRIDDRPQTVRRVRSAP